MPAPQEFHDSTLYFIRAETAVSLQSLPQMSILGTVANLQINTTLDISEN